MKPRTAAIFHALYLTLVWAASLWVPLRQRAEWWKEWHAELWHVHRACGSESAVWWQRERVVVSFCLGAFHDAHGLRGHAVRRRIRRIPLATTAGSAPQCLAFLAAIAVASFAMGLFLPGARAALQPSQYRDAYNLILIRNANSPDDAAPSISGAQFQRWSRLRQHLFDGFAFYGIQPEFVTGAGSMEIARSSSNLFDLLGLPIRYAWSGEQLGKQSGNAMPRLILSEAVWKRNFASRRSIAGQVVKVGLRDAVIVGVAPSDVWRLPGAADAWLLLPKSQIAPDQIGFVVAHLTSSGGHSGWGERWHLYTPRPDGSTDELLCSSFGERMRGGWNLFLLSVFLACLALPATTSLPLGEYRATSKRVSWQTRLRRWSFLVGKIALLLPLVYGISVDLAYFKQPVDLLSSQYIQLVFSFLICLFGLRWVLRDQRQRCPVCLGKLTHPARVGHPSRNFLGWHGTELICIGGHGLLHIPAMPTSWFRTQRWLYLDPSWDVLFSE
jgi:hypothetical protein